MKKVREGRIDYIYMNAKSANICTNAKIYTEGSVPWATDHKAVSITIAGPRVLRMEGGKGHGKGQCIKPKEQEKQKRTG